MSDEENNSFKKNIDDLNIITDISKIVQSIVDGSVYIEDLKKFRGENELFKLFFEINHKKKVFNEIVTRVDFEKILLLRLDEYKYYIDDFLIVKNLESLAKKFEKSIIYLLIFNNY